MSETTHEDLFNDGGTGQAAQQQGPAQLREALEKANAKLADRDKTIGELQAFKRDTAVKQFVEGKGLPEKAIGLIGDKDPDEWFKEYGDLFTSAANEGAAKQEPESGTTTTEPGGQGGLSAEEQAAIAAVGGVQAGTYQPGSNAELDSKLDSLESTAKTPDEFYAGLRDLGAAT